MRQGKAEDNDISCWQCGDLIKAHGKDARGLLNIGLRCGARDGYDPKDPLESRLFYQGAWYQPRDLPIEHFDIQWVSQRSRDQR